LHFVNRFFSHRSSETLPLNVLKTFHRYNELVFRQRCAKKLCVEFYSNDRAPREMFLLPIECVAIYDWHIQLPVLNFYTNPLENDLRRCNESYLWEKYTFEIDRPGLIVSDRATNTREVSMWRRSMPLLRIFR